MPEFEPIDRQQLRVDVRVSGNVEARQVANILTALDRAFARFVREEYGIPSARLQIVQTGVGSWWTILTSLKEIYDFNKDYPDVLPIFVQNIEVAFKAIKLGDQKPEQTAKYARDLLRDLAKAGKRIGADAVDIVCITKVSILQCYFDVLEIDQHIPESSSKNPGNATRPRAAMLTDREAVLQAAELARKRNLIGTLFKVAGSWYVRAEGMFGVLIPLQLSTLATLAAVDGRAYTFKGTLVRSPQGHPIGLNVEEMEFIE